jgi:hypothetical protein
VLEGAYTASDARQQSSESTDAGVNHQRWLVGLDELADIVADGGRSDALEDVGNLCAHVTN